MCCRNPWERLFLIYVNRAVSSDYKKEIHAVCKWKDLDLDKPGLTFERFLRCIASGTDDKQWKPQWMLCNVCSTAFSFIGHMETGENDATSVLSTLGFNKNFSHMFASEMHRSMEAFYLDIPPDLLKKLVEKYQFDFELYGYDKQPPGRDDVMVE